jgi:hypothetical protein
LTIYDDTGTDIANVGVRGDAFDAVTSHLQAELDLSSPVWLRAGRTYLMAVKPTTGTPNTISPILFTFPGTAERDALFGDSYAGSRTGSGSWSYNTLTSISIGPIVDQFSAEKSFVF